MVDRTRPRGHSRLGEGPLGPFSPAAPPWPPLKRYRTYRQLYSDSQQADSRKRHVTASRGRECERRANNENTVIVCKFSFNFIKSRILVLVAARRVARRVSIGEELVCSVDLSTPAAATRPDRTSAASTYVGVRHARRQGGDAPHHTREHRWGSSPH